MDNVSNDSGSLPASALSQAPCLNSGALNYFPSFDFVRHSIDIQSVKGDLRVSLSYEDFMHLLKIIISGLQVDEEWYARKYADIGEAIKLENITSARQHFISDGYFEGRLPSACNVDETWYLLRYPDVAEGIRTGVLTSAQQHFDENGYKEGRSPFEMPD
jgi:hypothetical protein